MSQKILQKKTALVPDFFKNSTKVKFHLQYCKRITCLPIFIFLLHISPPQKKWQKWWQNHNKSTDPSIQKHRNHRSHQRTSAAFSLKSPQSPAHMSSRAPAHHFSRFTLLRCSPVMQATNVSVTPTSKRQLKVKWRKVEVQKSKLIVWLLDLNSSKCI